MFIVLLQVKDTRIVCGGGCTEILMAEAVTQLASQTAGKEAIAMEAFARALRQLPTIIADNGGYDSADLISRLRAAHTSGTKSYGLGERHLPALPCACIYVPHLCMYIKNSSSNPM